MATARKLPSGSYRCLAYDGMKDGKRKYKSFTASTKKEAELLASQYLNTEKPAESSNMTFSQAMADYIKLRSSVLSPGTIREYKRSADKDYSLINDIDINSITQQDIQNLINEKAKTCKPKTVRNIHGFLFSVMKKYRPDFALDTTLPQKVHADLHIPIDQEIEKLLSCVEDEDILIAILLAAFGPMRRSEICGLESSDIKDGTAHIRRAVVMNDDGKWVDKTTKSTAGDRFIPLPDFVIGRIKDRKGRIVPLQPNMISDRFIDIRNASGLPHFRFHDLRHYCASIQHAMGIPDAYIMQRGGWKSDTVLKQVYRHALSDEAVKMNSKINEHFSQLCNTKMQHESE